ncbi:uncharacterized protein LOC111698277 isoform X2 [Eurytemora carolleeae]|uniref:uncharacterized protein LOC111698277 isoform X2 n=1 Tax=Eurytemora carolleeae TaxID=1294199 RepID=UPI000C789B7E|nr:uncharacterized protein LOC111698277 isoform X2 [Eurytemora carolleeae]|eukprot:XP_023324331.1 uncharacterized protein LOC111698277 isoform X2 [Eurytemora affinis]
MFILYLLILANTEASSSCVKQDCECKDFISNGCENPLSTSEVHADSIPTCLTNCKIFSSINLCEFALFQEPTQIHENCLAIGDEDVDIFLNTCQNHGQPLYDSEGNELMEDCDLCENCKNCKPCGVPLSHQVGVDCIKWNTSEFISIVVGEDCIKYNTTDFFYCSLCRLYKMEH